PNDTLPTLKLGQAEPDTVKVLSLAVALIVTTTWSALLPLCVWVVVLSVQALQMLLALSDSENFKTTLSPLSTMLRVPPLLNWTP
ncbi:hypothetical protein, partial [Chryseobacterium sp. SIMBA_028]|uniref:hypothetical protein n=1 Tax=Chryseobacterium sp. SIMBA_028 TaxID=3085771 RepID=UPI00397D2F69